MKLFSSKISWKFGQSSSHMASSAPQLFRTRELTNTVSFLSFFETRYSLLTFNVCIKKCKTYFSIFFCGEKLWVLLLAPNWNLLGWMTTNSAGVNAPKIFICQVFLTLYYSFSLQNEFPALKEWCWSISWFVRVAALHAWTVHSHGTFSTFILLRNIVQQQSKNTFYYTTIIVLLL